MVVQRFPSFGRFHARNKKVRNKKVNKLSKGERLKVFEASPDNACKGSVFLTQEPGHETHGMLVIGNISSVTSNTESNDSLPSGTTMTTGASAPTKDSSTTQTAPSVANSLARTMCSAGFTYDSKKYSRGSSIATDPYEKAETTSLTGMILSFFPSCFTPNNDDEAAPAKVETDDRSDVALNILSDDDTIEPIDDSTKVTPARREQVEKMEKKQGRKTLWFLRRNRSKADIFV